MKTLPPAWIRIGITLTALIMAALAGWLLWDYYLEEPWTRDGRVCADVVRVSPDVSGLVTEVKVKDNQRVNAGDLLFLVDPARFELALKQSEAALASAEAALGLARREAARYQKLAADNAVSHSSYDTKSVEAAQCEAALDLARANRDLARLNLDRSQVRATVNGILSNFSLRPGDYVSAGQPVTALVDADSFYVAGYFEETKLRRIHVGDPAQIRLMGDDHVLTGHVASLSAAVEDRERSDSSRLLANVNPAFSWVRLAQRIPVRVELDPVNGMAPTNLVAGQTATVTIQPQ